MSLPLYYQFQIQATKTQIDQMSEEQVRGFAKLLTERIFTQESFIQSVARDYAALNRPLPFAPLDPNHFNEGPQ